MRTSARARLWIEGATAGVSTCVLMATLIWKGWIETVLGLDPDNHSGAAEWAVVAAAALVTVAMVTAARLEWRRSRAATT